MVEANPTTAPPRQRWLTLPVVSAAQLLVVLDGTIVNIALPSAQRALDMTDANRHWVITAYLLAFGGLLLLGGRLSGTLGHRRAFLIGLSGFALASALGGMAAEPGILFAARALQGAFAALLAPAGLALLATTFTGERERGRAFGVFAAVGAAGAAVGLIAGGLLTQYAGWRWCLYINVPIAALAMLGAVRIPRDRPHGGTVDIPGALLSIAGFSALVYGFSRAEALGWTHPLVLALLGGGLAALAIFVRVELRAPHPLLPMRVLRHRGRAGAFTTIALTHVSMFGFFLFMSYHTQTVLDYSPVQAGLTLIVNALAAILGSTVIAGRLHGRVSPATLIVPSLLAIAAGIFVVTRTPARATDVLLPYLTPALLLTGLGLGGIMAATATLATSGIGGHDAGTASATYNASMQLGAALGTPLFNTVTIGAATSLALTESATVATVHGYRTALTVGLGIVLAATAIAAVTTRKA